MNRLAALLDKLESLHRQRFDIEQQIADAKRNIIAASKAQPKSRAKRAPTPDTIETIRPLLKTLREAGQPLRRGQLATRLSIAPWAVAYRLKMAIAAKFVVKMPGGRYRVVAEVPAL